jgi:hypothetical protein
VVEKAVGLFQQPEGNSLIDVFDIISAKSPTRSKTAYALRDFFKELLDAEPRRFSHTDAVFGRLVLGQDRHSFLGFMLREMRRYGGRESLY